MNRARAFRSGGSPCPPAGWPPGSGPGRDIRVNLAVSLHAADDATRSSLMPVNRSYGVEEVLAACRAYPLSKRQVIFIEYVLIDGLNDSAADARKLAGKLQGIRCRVNLLPYNESPSLPYRCSPPENRRISGNPARQRLPDPDQEQPRRGHLRRLRAAGIRGPGRPPRRRTRRRAAKSTCTLGACVLNNSDTCTGARSSAG